MGRASSYSVLLLLGVYAVVAAGSYSSQKQKSHPNDYTDSYRPSVSRTATQHVIYGSDGGAARKTSKPEYGADSRGSRNYGTDSRHPFTSSGSFSGRPAGVPQGNKDTLRSSNTRYSEVSTRIIEDTEGEIGRGRNPPPKHRYWGEPDDRERPLILNGVAVPLYKFRGEEAQLECQYDQGTDPLYSVKWYKDDSEFFRYLFSQKRPKRVFEVAGVHVDINRSNERRVVLMNLTFSSTGIYKCEVSADKPLFRTYEHQSDMVVVELPSNPPTITGARSHYRVGDIARMNCTSGKSKPAPELTWYINGEEASSEHLEPYYPWVYRDDLESKRLGLSFQVDKDHFGPTGDMEVRCRATVFAVYPGQESHSSPTVTPKVLEHREKLIRVRNSGNLTTATREVSVLALTVVSLLMRQYMQ